MATPGRETPHMVGPCPASGGRRVGPAALWRQTPMGISNVKTGKVC